MIFKVLLLVNNLFDVLMNRDVYQFYTNISADQALPPALLILYVMSYRQFWSILLLNSNEQNSYGSHRFYFKRCFEDNVSVMLQEKVNMR